MSKHRYRIKAHGEEHLLKPAVDGQKEVIKTKAQEKAERVRAFRREASRMASMANKRLQRLEKNGLKDSPAYKSWLAHGGEKFGIRGKTYNEVQKEVARMRQFIDAESSTVRGVNRILKGMAKSTGMKYKNLKELHKSAGKFFDLASKIEQYLRTVEDMASAIGYQKIWESINVYIEREKVDLGSATVNVEQLTQQIVEAMQEYEKKERISGRAQGVSLSGWFKLED